MSRPDSERVIYGCYDAVGILLYVGQTRNLRQRMASHACENPSWSRLVKRVEILDTADDLADAERKERALIVKLRPIRNLKLYKPQMTWDVDDYLRAIESQMLACPNPPNMTYRMIRQVAQYFGVVVPTSRREAIAFLADYYATRVVVIQQAEDAA